MEKITAPNFRRRPKKFEEEDEFPQRWVDYYHNLDLKKLEEGLPNDDSSIEIDRGKLRYEYQEKKYNRPLRIKREVNSKSSAREPKVDETYP